MPSSFRRGSPALAPVARSPLGVSNRDNDNAMVRVAEHDAEWIALQGTVTAAGACTGKSLGILDNLCNCIVNRCREAGCRSRAAPGIPVERLIEVTPCTGMKLKGSCHGRSAPAPRRELGSTE